jgi:UDP-N-acetylmuramoyl-tripeptide--D-alanyl-D-alanine ligase
MSTQIPENRARFSLSEILAATGGRVLGAPGSVVEIEGVSTDSRSILAGKCFVALRGEHFDAHRFLRKAADSGARVLVVEEQAELEELLEGQGLGSGGSSPPGGPALVVVGDTLIALGALARRHRERWGGKLATVAGSAGKTTTRSVTSALLSAMHPGEVHSTVGNLNNRIGVPMVLLGLCSEHSYAVVEIGTNCPGEVKALTELAQPNLAVLTLIDLEHTEGLGDLDGVEREERQAFSALGGRGIAVGFGEDERVLRSVLNAPAGRRATYGFEVGRDLRIVSRELLGTQGERVLLKRKDGSELSIETPLPGRPNVLALAAGLTVVELLSDVRLEPRRIEAALWVRGSAGVRRLSSFPGALSLLMTPTTPAQRASQRVSKPAGSCPAFLVDACG